LVFIGSLFVAYVTYQRGEIKELDNKILVFQANEKLNEIQKEALRSAILDQNDAVEKQRIDAVKKLETFKTAQYAINAKYERERIRVSDLNGTAECDAIREMIKGAL
jgi:predicted DNA binding CopG/RHH family protein